jgi:hypothetical protein
MVGEGLLRNGEGKAGEDLEIIFLAILHIDLSLSINGEYVLSIEMKIQIIIVIYFKMLLEFDLIFQSCQRWNAT